jgi:hypothetical protein
MYFLTVDAVHSVPLLAGSPGGSCSRVSGAVLGEGVEEGPTRGWWGDAEIGVHDSGLAFSSGNEDEGSGAGSGSGGGTDSRNDTRDALRITII